MAKAKQSTQLPLDDMRWRPDVELVEKLLPHIGDKILIAHDLTEAVASKKIHCMRRIVMGPADAAGLYDIELEQVILGAALLNQSFEGEVIERVFSAESFSEPLHRQLFEAIASVRASHGVITPQLIIASMGGDAGMIVANGITLGQYVARLVAEAALPRNVPGHRELVPASFWADHCFACSSNGDIRVAFRPPPNSGFSFTWIVHWSFYLWLPDCVKAWPALVPQAVAARAAAARSRRAASRDHERQRNGSCLSP
jgi:hypothetical protein